MAWVVGEKGLEPQWASGSVYWTKVVERKASRNKYRGGREKVGASRDIPEDHLLPKWPPERQEGEESLKYEDQSDICICRELVSHAIYWGSCWSTQFLDRLQFLLFSSFQISLRGSGRGEADPGRYKWWLILNPYEFIGSGFFFLTVLHSSGRAVSEWGTRFLSRKTKFHLHFSLNNLSVLWLTLRQRWLRRAWKK